MNTRGPTTVEVERRLAFYAGITREVVERYLPDPSDRYLGDVVRDYPLRSGKGLRAALCIAAARAFGDNGNGARYPAAAIELLHAAFLVHDDIQDGSQHRRGGPTLHRRFGVPLALNAGDALAVLSFEPLHDARDRLGSRVTALLLDEFRTAIWRTLEGQSVELGWRNDGEVGLGVDDYLAMVMRKTCFYTTILPLRMGAIIGRGHQRDLDPLSRFGYFLGAAFQIQDDLLNLVGELEVYGKEINGDLYEGKRSLPIVHLLTRTEGDDRRSVVDFLVKPREERTTDDVRRLEELFHRHRSIDYARRLGAELAAAAARSLDDAAAGIDDNPDLEFIRLLADFVTTRRM